MKLGQKLDWGTTHFWNRGTIARSCYAPAGAAGALPLGQE